MAQSVNLKQRTIAFVLYYEEDLNTGEDIMGTTEMFEYKGTYFIMETEFVLDSAVHLDDVNPKGARVIDWSTEPVIIMQRWENTTGQAIPLEFVTGEFK